ncbi:DUF3601 domain-containing protein [Brevundimonas sp.]|uniref:DUF3601 domain-containing protein n=1 Tax=Brevundimonas sp. TaxID=1871086 RepID=UPI003BABB210
MHGPKPAGHWTRLIPAEPYRLLRPGRAYIVTQAFTDYDESVHPVGERWVYLGSNFLPYDDGLSLFVSLDGSQEWHIRMQLRDEEQGPVVNDLDSYIRRDTSR